MQTNTVAHNVNELFEHVARATNASLFFHFCEARLRLGRLTNDFSQWLHDIGEFELAAAIERLNPYALTFEELREQISSLAPKQIA
ncbi:MAG: hypothetical protein HY644_04320 [Acidobacteria bacterium]|nr:hypothetical protein [Acidobacteriota bacterium]